MTVALLLLDWLASGADFMAHCTIVVLVAVQQNCQKFAHSKLKRKLFDLNNEKYKM